MGKISISVTAVATGLLLAGPAPAQAPQGDPMERTVPATKPAPAPKVKAAPARDSIGKVTWDKVAGNWKRFRGSIRRQWGRLTANEVQVARGNREALNGYIRARYGIDKEKADKQIDDWLKTLK